jgi:hypothetical protein
LESNYRWSTVPTEERGTGSPANAQSYACSKAIWGEASFPRKGEKFVQLRWNGSGQRKNHSIAATRSEQKKRDTRSVPSKIVLAQGLMPGLTWVNLHIKGGKRVAEFGAPSKQARKRKKPKQSLLPLRSIRALCKATKAQWPHRPRGILSQEGSVRKQRTCFLGFACVFVPSSNGSELGDKEESGWLLSGVWGRGHILLLSRIRLFRHYDCEVLDASCSSPTCDIMGLWR